MMGSCMKKSCCWALFLLGLAASHGEVTYTPWIPIFKGIDRASGTNTAGYTGGQHVAQAVRIDLQDPDVRLFTTPPVTNNWVANSRETLSQRPTTFLKTYQLKVAINGAHYAPSSYNGTDGVNEWVHGLVISQGRFVSPYDGTYGADDSDALMYFTSNKVASFIPYNSQRYDVTNDMYHAIPGMYALVWDGMNVGYNYPIGGGIHSPQPRSAIGYSQDGRYLILLTIDGRQSDSDGAVDYETADWLIRFGAWNGMNLDGGGSACIVMANECGDPVVLNDPSIRYATGDPTRVRSVGHNIGVYARSLPATFMQDALVTPGRTIAILQWNTPSPATTQVEYGLTTALGRLSPLDATPRTNHMVVLTGLAPGVTNYFRLLSVAGAQYATPVCSFLTLTNPPALVAPSNNLNLLFDVTHEWKYSTNNLDGVAWTQKTYNDAGWNSGPGLLCVEVNTYVSPKNTILPTPCDPLPPGELCTYLPRTYYFRTHFTFPTNAANVTLAFTNWIDDGAVFYLNGVEINRVRMPAAPTTIYNNTLAIGFTQTGYPSSDPRYGDAIYEAPTVFTLSGAVVTNNLVQGDNVMAVEVHNYSAGSPDIVFGTALYYTKSVIQATNALVVLTADVNQPVTVDFSPADNYGYGAGTTPCERLYYPSANPLVTAAPTNASGQVFKKWQLDGADYSTSLTASVSMAASHLLVAVYAPPDPEPPPTWTLAVSSANPNSGVDIAVTPPDINTNGTGVTFFTRTYTNGTVVTLTAPADIGIGHFAKWQRGGADYATNPAITITMSTNITLTAVYAPAVWTLSVASLNPDTEVVIGVNPVDNQGVGDGATPFNRQYTHGAQVDLIAPATVGSSVFQKWLLDGADYSSNRVLSLTLTANHSLTAVYTTPRWTLSISSSQAGLTVPVEVQPPDVNGDTNGFTPLARTYLAATLTTVTAPASVGTNLFLGWLLDGIFQSNLVIHVTMNTNHTLNAMYYSPLWTLTVNSLEPANDVLIAIAPSDHQGNGDGATPLTRRYYHGSVVALSAPPQAGTNLFAKWQSGGADLSTNRTLQLTMRAHTEVTAVYAPAAVEPPKLTLTLQPQASAFVLNWTNIGYTLQQATNLSLSNWNDVAGPVTNGPYTNQLSDPAGFFRLRK